MSHLSTLIARVQRRLDMNDSEEEAKKDKLFLQAVRNLKEYQETYKDFDKKEKIIADRLYARYAYLLKR